MPANTTTTTSGLEALRGTLDGELFTPSDAGWDQARQTFNLAADQRPAAIVAAASVRDVAQAVRAARDADLRVAPQSTGHNACALDTLERSLLVKTTNLKGVEIDAAARRARVGAGAQWGDVVPGAAEHGLAALHGSSPTVGVAGYSLGGGIGWLARSKGLQTNSITAVELIDANGELVRADADHEPDLFWALRGGGGNFGVVTALEFELHPVGDIYAGIMFWPLEQGLDVMHAWHESLASYPEELTTSMRVLRLPPLPEIPEPLRGGAFVVIDGAFLGSAADGAELLAPLRETPTVVDTFAPVGPEALSRLHMDPEDPIAGVSTSALLRDVPAKTIDDIYAVVGPDSGTSLMMFELRQLGGALGRVAPGSGALGRLDGDLVMYAAGALMEPLTRPVIERDLARLDDVVAPFDSGRYLNFTEEPLDTAVAYDEEAYRRLRAVKAAYDPEDVFQANHPIRPAA